jgi:hypothetical protein
MKVRVHVLENERQRAGGVVEDAVDQRDDVLVLELPQDAHLSYDVVRDARV